MNEDKKVYTPAPQAHVVVTNDPIAWAEVYDGKIVTVQLDRSKWHTTPLYLPAPAPLLVGSEPLEWENESNTTIQASTMAGKYTVSRTETGYLLYLPDNRRPEDSVFETQDDARNAAQKDHAQRNSVTVTTQNKSLVIIESPFAGDVEANVAYGRAAVRDCLLRGEAPYASHLLYTQPGVLDDGIPEQRTLGIEAGLAWGRLASKTVVYTDLGISKGMQLGIDRARSEGRAVEYRSMPQEDADA